MKYIYLMPIGEINSNILRKLEDTLEDVFNIPIKSAIRTDIPQQSFNRSRRQYEADKVLLEVARLNLPQDSKVLAITNVDLYTQGLNFVFGLADIGGRNCLISTARLDPCFWGDEPDDKLFLERTIKEAVHELGHTFGLTHCQDPRCVMHFSNSLNDTDYKRSSFCALCQTKIQES